MLPFLILLHACLVSAQDRSCAGGYQPGSQVERGRYWYECQDGQLIPKGCLSENGRRMNIGETYDDRNGVRMQCVVGRDGYLSFVYKSCANNGREYQVNEQWEDQNNYYICKRDRDFVAVEVAGCMEEGKRVAVDDKVSKGDLVYQCKKNMDQSFNLVRVGCNSDGRQYAIGDSFTKSDNQWYMCTTTSNDRDARVVHKVIGCIDDGQKLKAGDRATHDEIVYECFVDDYSAKMKPVACVTRDNGVTMHRRVDCTWVDGDEPHQYEITCKKVEPNSAVREYLRCLYTIPRGTIAMKPGCYRLIETTLVGCWRDSNSKLQIRTFGVESANEATSLGLRFC